MPVENNILELMPNFVKNHWDYNKNKVSPEEVSIFSKSHYYWKNESSASFFFKPSQVHSRLNNTSLPEQTIFYFLQKIFNDTKSRHIFINGTKKFEADIYIPSLDLVIEYDGSYYHKGKEKYNLDIEKNDFFQSKGLFCIRIREKGLQTLPEFYGILLNKENLQDIDMVNVVFETIEKYMLSYKYNNNLRAVSEFKLTEKEYNNTLKNIDKLLWLDSEDMYSCEAVINFYRIHKKNIYSPSKLKAFVDIWECCDYLESPFRTIKDTRFIKEITKIKKLYFFDFAIFTTKDDKQWLYDYFVNLIYNDSYFVNIMEHTIYDVLSLNLVKELEKGEYISVENTLQKKGVNIDDDILNMMIVFCKLIIVKHPNYYRKWVYEKIICEIDKYLKYMN